MSDRLRQTGRTTRMLTEAVAAAMSGERVLVFAPTYAMADDLRRRMLEMFAALPASPEDVARGRLATTVLTEARSARGMPRGTRLFFDHTWWEHASHAQLGEANFLVQALRA